ncbi:MAG: carboxylating nicotinate-nucleotide diphosphorylase [Gammaproteobacteria bacterium]|nr:carboxylating nicotinate-nucleotide diphosphorylase [Gammaproteobacteria bacterium]
MKQSIDTHVHDTVAIALKEDLAGKQDITALLIPSDTMARAQVVTREDAIVCGQAWVNEVFRQVNPKISVNWHCKDGDFVVADTMLYDLSGPARGLLTGERVALNFLQMLSGVATVTHNYLEQINDLETKLLDTRKTIPGLRLAEKYAVRCGGGTNHRMGLYDAFLIKENHIIARGSIAEAVSQAKRIDRNKKIEVEVESLEQLTEAIEAGADIVMLDNFTTKEMQSAVELAQKQVKLEVSGNVTLETIREFAKTSVDYISVGALTKNVKAIDLSMRFV